MDLLCHEVRREPLEITDQAIFDELDPGDILFIDGSHASCTNSDVTVGFLPRIRPGVLVHIHDVHLPYDYPTILADWFYNEQYLVAVQLLAAKGGYEIILPAAFIHNDPELSAILRPVWDALPADTFDTDGSSLWITKTE